MPAGWYPDPAGSGSQRWWGGVQWTEHLKAPEPPVYQAPPAPEPPPVYHAPPEVGTVGPQSFNPFALEQQPQQQYHQQFQDRGIDAYRYAPTAPINNNQGWISLAAGIVAVVLLGASEVLGVLVFGILAGGIIGLGNGMRSLAARKAGTSTLFGPPVAGIVLSCIALLGWLGNVILFRILQ